MAILFTKVGTRGSSTEKWNEKKEFSLGILWVSTCGTVVGVSSRQENFQEKGEPLVYTVCGNWRHREGKISQGAGVGWADRRVGHETLGTHQPKEDRASWGESSQLCQLCHREWHPVEQNQKEEGWGGTVCVNVVFQEAQLGKERERAKRHYWLVGGLLFYF